MNDTSTRWTARIAWALLLLVAGATLAVWSLSRWQSGARFLGVAPTPALTAQPLTLQPLAATVPTASASDADAGARLAAVEGRLASVEDAIHRADRSAGRADALLVAFAARRAIDRGVALGYLEPMLVDRFSGGHETAVATLLTAARQPVTLAQLADRYQQLGPTLRSAAPDQGLLSRIGQELGSMVELRRASVPSGLPSARYDQALQRLQQGEVDVALAQTMRLPAAPRAADWVEAARRYVSAHRALDELESAALIGPSAQGPAVR